MTLCRRSFAAFSLAALVAPRAALAQANGAMTIVELFTSQGCSSCPPADALMVEFAKEKGMIPLTFPVEIWDHLGWKDTLARREFTLRQRAYAASVAGKRIYTPQAIINGRAHCVGSDFAQIVRLKGVAAGGSGVRIALSRAGGGWSAVVSGPAAQARLVLVPMASRITVPVGRGENSGRTITYANVARDIRDLGAVTEGAALPISQADVAAERADGFVLLVQAGSPAAPGAVLAGACAGPDGIKA